MENLAILVNMDQDSSTDEIVKNSVDQKFYRPLCLTGYLTPLQRKRLREKRCLESVDVETRDSTEIIKSRGVKRKKEHCSNLPRKCKKQSKRTKSISQIQCAASKIIFKTVDENVKEKKFFKTSSSNRLEKANFCMPLVFKRNLFLNIDKCVKENCCYSERKTILKECSYNHSSSESFESAEEVNTAALCLEANKEYSDSDIECSLPRISGVEMSENLYLKEKSVFDFDWPSDELLLRRQEAARANVKRQKLLKESMKDAGSEQQSVAKPTKLYPIFYVTSKRQSNSHQDTKRKQKNGSKRIKESLNGGEQMIIDAGQKEIGAKICSTCNMVYSIGLEGDEKLHLNYHSMFLTSLKFPGWKEENVIGEYGDGRVIMIRKNDQSFKLKKIRDVLVIANRDLGFSTSAFPSKSDVTFILFISNTKQVAGCVIAEPITLAYRVLLADREPATKDLFTDQENNIWRIGNWYSSSEGVPAVCGINRIWVTHSYRRCKVASRMIDCLRYHFIHGHVIGIRELAFTDPSPDGREFAAVYTGTDNFLVYR